MGLPVEKAKRDAALVQPSPSLKVRRTNSSSGRRTLVIDKLGLSSARAGERFTCKNCADVDLANKHVDPAHPASGPYDVNAASDPSRHDVAVKLGGALVNLTSSGLSPADDVLNPVADLYRSGTQIDIAA